ncbi:MAG: hypothetical protein IJ105_00235 [Bacilli bacterium]|nr:hypothetical protein [Bacilli bacterium]
MKPEIKKYILNDNLTINKLKKNNFKEGGFIKEIPSPKYYYYKRLIDDIELHIEISVNNDETFNFDDFDNIIVLDDSFCQPYTPFYESKKGFSFLNKVIIEYNKAMDELVEKGILKEKQLEIENDIKINKLKK